MLLTKEGREGGFLISVIFVDSVFFWVSIGFGIFLCWQRSMSSSLRTTRFISCTFSCLLACLLLLGFSLLGAVFMFHQINVHIITWVCGSYKTYCSGVSQVLAQRCWHQYVCSPISVPNISTQSFLHNYLQSFVGSSLQSLFGDLGFRSQLSPKKLLMKSYIIYEMYMKLKKEYCWRLDFWSWKNLGGVWDVEV